MKIQNNTKINHINSLSAVNFTSTKFPETFAEQVQKASRRIYHYAHIDGKKGQKGELYPDLAIKIVDRVTLYASMDGYRDEKSLPKKIMVKLNELYEIAFADAKNGAKYGWANATMIRNQIADILASEGFKNAAKKLKANVNDNLSGDY